MAASFDPDGTQPSRSLHQLGPVGSKDAPLGFYTLVVGQPWAASWDSRRLSVFVPPRSTPPSSRSQPSVRPSGCCPPRKRTWCPSPQCCLRSIGCFPRPREVPDPRSKVVVQICTRTTSRSWPSQSPCSDQACSCCRSAFKCVPRLCLLAMDVGESIPGAAASVLLCVLLCLLPLAGAVVFSLA